MKDKSYKHITLLLFLLSGMVSLILQVVWLKMLVLVFGNTIWAVSTLLTTFMAGLAIGSWLFGRIADRTGSPLKLYGILEAAIGLLALLTPFLFGNLDIIYKPLYSLLGGDSFMMGIGKFIISFIILLIPTIMMGGTLPLLAKKFTKKIDKAGTSIGTLYTVNTLGAVLGTFLSGFIMIPFLGVKLTIITAAGVNFMIFLVIFILTKKESFKFKTDGLLKAIKIKSESSYVLSVFFGCGFAALAYEVFWSRILVLHIGSSVYAYSVMLGIYLLGIALGAGLMSYFLPKIKKPGLVFAIIQMLIALHILVQIKQFGSLTMTISNLGMVMGTENYTAFIGSLLLATAQIILIPTLFFGASFPLAVKLFVRDKSKVGSEIGQLYAFNTFGTIFGSFCAGFLMLPFIGVQMSLLLIGFVNIGLGLSLILKTGDRRKAGLILTISVLAVYLTFIMLFIKKDEVLLNAGIFSNQPGADVEILNFSEDVYATVSVEERTDVSGRWRSLSLNGVNVAGTSCELFTIQKMQGHLPLLLHPDPESVLHIGFGSGGTAWAVSRYPVKSITIAEISKSIIEKSSIYFQDINHNVLEDKRVNVHYTDGRNFILATDQKFDVILSDSIHPRFSGNGSLYTYDYYKLLKERLNPGGVVSQWLPFYSVTPRNFKMIIKSFSEVFPYTSVWYINSTFNAYVIVIGRTDTEKIDFTSMKKKLELETVKIDLKETLSDNIYNILDFFLFANEEVINYVGDVPLHTDDNMAVEYESGRVLSRMKTTIVSYDELLRQRQSIIPYLNIEEENTGLSRAEITDQIKKYENATSYNLRGQMLFYLGRRAQAFKLFEMIPYYNPDDLEPVEYFGAPYQRPFLRKAKFAD